MIRKQLHKCFFTIRIIASLDSNFFRCFIHPVTQKEKYLVGYPFSLLRIHKKGFAGTHIPSVFHHRADMAFHILPVHGCNRCFLCLRSITDTHAVFIKPYRHRMTANFKAFPGLSVFIFQKLYHALCIPALGIFGIDTLSAVLLSPTTS